MYEPTGKAPSNTEFFSIGSQGKAAVLYRGLRGMLWVALCLVCVEMLHQVKCSEPTGEAVHTSAKATTREPGATAKLRARLLCLAAEKPLKIRPYLFKRIMLRDDVCNANIAGRTI